MDNTIPIQYRFKQPKHRINKFNSDLMKKLSDEKNALLNLKVLLILRLIVWTI